MATSEVRLRARATEVRLEVNIITGELRRLLAERAEHRRREQAVETLVWRRLDSLLSEVGDLTTLVETSA